LFLFEDGAVPASSILERDPMSRSITSMLGNMMMAMRHSPDATSDRDGHVRAV